MTPPLAPHVLAAREGFQVPGAESFYGRPIWHLSLFGVDVSINRTVVITLAATLIVALLFLIAFRKPKVVPRGLQNLLELGIDFVRRQIVMPVMGEKGLVYLPYLTTLFFFVFFCNVFEVIPGVNFPATSRLALPAALSVITWLLFVWAGIKANGAGRYFKTALIPPGVPRPVLLLLVPVEALSTFIIRPLTLTIRLTANMIAGHMLLTVFFLGTAYLYGRHLTFGFGVISMIVSVGFVGFEIFVAGLQAFIFAILTAVYIAGSLEPAH